MKSFVFALLVALAAPVSAMEPRDVERLVHTAGAPSAVASIWKSEATTKQLLKGVAAAKPAWVRVGLLLAPATDAGSAEELDDAFAAALLAAPYEVLPRLRARWWPSKGQLCQFGPDSELPGGATAYVRRLSAALDRQYTPARKKLRAECRRGIKSTITASASAGA